MTYLGIHDAPGRVQVDNSPGIPDVPSRVELDNLIGIQDVARAVQVDDLPGNSRRSKSSKSYLLILYI